MPPPQNQSEVRSLLGMANYSARFIPEYSLITQPLSKLTKKNSEWLWGKEQTNDPQKQTGKCPCDEL